MALLAHVIDQQIPLAGKFATRLSFDILGPVRIEPFDIEVSMVRDGRNISLLSASLMQAGRVAMMASVWRVSVEENVVAYGASTAPKDTVALPPALSLDPGGQQGGGADGGINTFGYGQASDWFFSSGSFLEPGPALVWNRVRRPLLGEEFATATERALLLADAGSGVGAALPWDKFAFPNVDLTMHISRPPRGDWLGVDARTWIGGTGSGMAVSALLDEEGRFGTACQSLFVRRRQR